MNIEDLSELEFARYFRDIREMILKDPLKNFIRAKGLINFKPTPAQTVAMKCVFGQELDGVTQHKIYMETVDEEGKFDLTESAFTETGIFKYMTGFDYENTSQGYNKINFILGRRGGKSSVAAMLAVFSSIKVNWNPYLSKTPVATVAVLSHTVDFSQEILDIIKGLIDDSAILSRLRDPHRKNTQSTFHLKVPFLDENDKIEYSSIAIKVGAASKKTTRGRAVCTLLCDEIAFWNLDKDSAEPDTEILKAIRPSLLQFGNQGTIIKLSSPATKQGVLYEEWLRREELRGEYLQFKAPSWTWNTILPIEEFKKEHSYDPDGFDTEFRANFVDSISNFIQPEFVDLCTVKGVTFQTPADEREVQYSAAIDAAFKNDRFGFSLVGFNGKRVTQYVLKFWEGSKKHPVQAHEVAAYIRTICNEYGVTNVVGDQYAFQPLREIFLQYGVNLIEGTFTNIYKRKIYFGLKRLIHSQQIDLLDIPLLAKEIKELQVEQSPSGQIKIGHPQGGNDDLATVTAVASYVALENAGLVQFANGGEMASGNTYGIITDVTGRSYQAPAPEMLHRYQGFGNVVDNLSEFVKDPITGKLKHISEVENAQDSEEGNFIF